MKGNTCMENLGSVSTATPRKFFAAEYSGLQGEPVRPGARLPRFQRIALVDQLVGTLNGCKAVVLDISLSGALIAHQIGTSPGDRVALRFEWKGDAIYVIGRVTRTEIHKPALRLSRSVYRSGVSFQEFVGHSEKNLRTMVGDLVARALDEQRANARGIPAQAASSVQRGSSTRGFLALRFINGAWRRLESIDPAQPLDGFTVSIEEQAGQVAMLCSTYEKLATAERKLIRDIAALSLSNNGGIPTRRYEP